MLQAQLQLDGTQQLNGFPDGFPEWLRANHGIYSAFVRSSLTMCRAGRAHYSARTIVEKMRWDTDLSETNSRFKISNNMIPGMARLAMQQYQELDGFFNTHRDDCARPV